MKLRKYITEQEKFFTREDITYGDLNGDLENETINLITEIRTER